MLRLRVVVVGFFFSLVCRLLNAASSCVSHFILLYNINTTFFCFCFLSPLPPPPRSPLTLARPIFFSPNFFLVFSFRFRFMHAAMWLSFNVLAIVLIFYEHPTLILVYNLVAFVFVFFSWCIVWVAYRIIYKRTILRMLAKQEQQHTAHSRTTDKKRRSRNLKNMLVAKTKILYIIF